MRHAADRASATENEYGEDEGMRSMGEFARSAAKPSVTDASNAGHDFMRTFQILPATSLMRKLVERVQDGLGLIGGNLGLTGAERFREREAASCLRSDAAVIIKAAIIRDVTS
jgi:hypothetical protein